MEVLEKEKRAQHLGERGECARRRNGDLTIKADSPYPRLQGTLKKLFVDARTIVLYSEGEQKANK